MAKLKQIPLVLSVIKTVCVLSIIIFAGGLFFTIIGFLSDEPFITFALMATFAGITTFASFLGLYYLVKAACIYIEKEEAQ